MTDEKKTTERIIMPEAEPPAAAAKPPLRAKRCETCDAGFFPSANGPIGLCMMAPPKHFVFLVPNHKAVSTTGGPVVEPAGISQRPQVTRDDYCVRDWLPRAPAGITGDVASKQSH